MLLHRYSTSSIYGSRNESVNNLNSSLIYTSVHLQFNQYSNIFGCCYGYHPVVLLRISYILYQSLGDVPPCLLASVFMIPLCIKNWVHLQCDGLTYKDNASGKITGLKHWLWLRVTHFSSLSRLTALSGHGR